MNTCEFCEKTFVCDGSQGYAGHVFICRQESDIKAVVALAESRGWKLAGIDVPGCSSQYWLGPNGEKVDSLADLAKAMEVA